MQKVATAFWINLQSLLDPRNEQRQLVVPKSEPSENPLQT